LSDISVLNYKRNDSLVFDAAGKCILSLHSTEDLRTSGEHHAVKSRGSSKGKKRSPQSLQDSEVPPMKKRRKIIEESEDEDDNQGCPRVRITAGDLPESPVGKIRQIRIRGSDSFQIPIAHGSGSDESIHG
jgi:hypothetical protein